MQEKSAKEKEARITDAAIKLFVRHGFRKVTMSDIAEACSMSRPTLYASFPNKEAIFNALANLHNEMNEAETVRTLGKKKTLKDRLECLFEIWIIAPYASIIDSENALELMANAETYGPEGIGKTYTRFEHHLREVISHEVQKRKDLSAKDMAHILMLATKGLKSSTATLAELRRLTDGLISMTLAAVGNRAPTK